MRKKAHALLTLLWLEVVWLIRIASSLLRGLWHRREWRAMQWAFVPDLAAVTEASRIFDFHWFGMHCEDAYRCAAVARGYYEAGDHAKANYWRVRLADFAVGDVRRSRRENEEALRAEQVARGLVEGSKAPARKSAGGSVRR